MSREPLPMNKRTRDALGIVCQFGPLTRGAVASAMGIAPNTAGVYLWKLSCRGLVQSTGPGRFSTWSAA